MRYDFLVVGAGLTGCVLAERIASHGKTVVVVDRHDYVGGNAHDRVDLATGVRYNIHGPHIFHTNSTEVFEYLSKFTDWIPYQHQVRAVVPVGDIPLPINFNSLRTIYGWRSAETVIDALIGQFGDGRGVTIRGLRSHEDRGLAEVGQDLWKLVFDNYSRRHWGMDPELLHPMVTGRIPLRLSGDNRHFLDRYQYSPVEGYTEMMWNILNKYSKFINVCLGVEEESWRDYKADRIIFTGGIDSYFDHCYGQLPYRSLEIEIDRLRSTAKNAYRLRDIATFNYPSSEKVLRKTYQSLVSRQRTQNDIVILESPQDYEPGREQYYPVPTEASRDLYEKYLTLARQEAPNTVFAGRLGRYQYIEMGQAVAGALSIHQRLALTL